MPERRKMSTNKFPEYVQFYDLHMKNGEVMVYGEDYDTPPGKGIIGDFKSGKKKYLEYGNQFHDYVIPFDQISFIVSTNVQKCF